MSDIAYLLQVLMRRGPKNSTKASLSPNASLVVASAFGLTRPILLLQATMHWEAISQFDVDASRNVKSRVVRHILALGKP